MPLLHISGARKHFGATRALDGVDLQVGRGEVHAVIGENGAGKSTLMKILSTSIRPDEGSIHFQDLPYAPSGPLEARRLGIAHIHQELSLCPHLSVAENIFLGLEPKRAGWVDYRELNRQAAEILDVFQHPDITPQRRVADLNIAARQIVEISRTLAQRASLILMDEPTSSLQRMDVERLFEFIRKLRSSGISVIYISHFLEEVREIADTFTVLRDGQSVLSGAIQDVTNEKLIAAMVGRPVQDLFPARVGSIASDCALRVQGLNAPPDLENVSFELHRGEILGIAGLIGSGRTELLRTLFGLQAAYAGSISVFGQALPLHGSPYSRIARGVGYLSEDRKGEGLALSLSVADNITLTNFASCSQWGWIDLKQQRQKAERWADAVKVKGPGVDSPVQRLSGGNQQKVAIARLLHQGCEIFLLDEPTCGVDVSSKSQIYDAITGLARAGQAVLMVSSYLPELVGGCDRLAVMSRGRLSATRSIGEWTTDTVMAAGSGLHI